MDAIEKARQLGAEHGREAGQRHAAMVAERGPVTTITLPDGEVVGFRNAFSLPEPDLSSDHEMMKALFGREPSDFAVMDAYDDAFREARDETIRGKVTS